MVSVTVQITNLDNVKGRLDQLGASLMDFTDGLTSLGTMLVRFFSDTVFNSEGAALNSAPWMRLKEATVAQKQNKWPGRGILQRSGTLQEGFVHEVTPDTLFVTNRVEWFPYHQLGTSEGRGRGHNIPRRQMIGVNATVESMIQTVIEAAVRAKIDTTTGA